MNDNSENPAYSWDDHFGLRDDLMSLEDYRRRFIDSDDVELADRRKYLIHEFRHNAARMPSILSGDREFFAHIEAAAVRLADLGNRHAMMCAKRAHAITIYMDDLLENFPERHWVPFIRDELNKSGLMLEGLHHSLHAIAPLYRSFEAGYYGDQMWFRAMQAIEISKSHHADFADRMPVENSGWQDMNLLKHRAAILAGLQKPMAEEAWLHALVQTKLVRETLKLVTTLDFLNSSERTHYHESMNALLGAASHVIIDTDFTLAEAARKRTASFASRDLQRPVF